jgi:hypothetical protein
MTTSSQIRPEPPFVAELVSAAGAVLEYSVEGALERLIGALDEKSEAAPYGAIVTLKDNPPTAAQAWRSCLSAWSRVGQFLETAPDESLGRTHSIAQLDWPEDLRLVSSSYHGEGRVAAHNIARVYVDASHQTHPIPVEDVFLLLTPSKLQEMLPAQIARLLLDERVLIQVLGEGSIQSGRYPPAKRPTQRSLLLSRSDDDPPTDRPTLEWRQWFVKNVKCLTAAQVAQEGGHQAKNTSATASRWRSEGKIFSVGHAGQLLYPAFQFRHGQPLPVIARILRAVGTDPTGWDYAFFLATPNAYLGSDRPMDKLHDNKMEEELVRLAERHGHPADVF